MKSAINQIAFAAIGLRENTLHQAHVCQMIHMPVRAFSGAKMAPQTGRQAAGTIGAAEIKIGAGRQDDLAQRANFPGKSARQANQQPIGAGIGR